MRRGQKISNASSHTASCSPRVFYCAFSSEESPRRGGSGGLVSGRAQAGDLGQFYRLHNICLPKPARASANKCFKESLGIWKNAVRQFAVERLAGENGGEERGFLLRACFSINAEAERKAAQHRSTTDRALEEAKKNKRLTTMKSHFKKAIVAFAQDRLATKAQLKSALTAAPSDAKKLDVLKGQVRHYVEGLGLTDATFGPKLRFSAKEDPSVGTHAELTTRVETMVTAAAKMALPTEPPLPELPIRTVETLGTVTTQR